MARWITIVKAPFDFVWPGRRAITHFSTKEIGLELHAKDELADFAVAGGFATEGKAEGSTTKSRKSGPKAVRARKPAKVPSNRRALEEPKRPRKKAEPAVAIVAETVDSAPDAGAAIIQSDDNVDGESVAASDSTEIRSDVDSDAGQR